MDITVLKKELINWLADWFEKNGKGCNAVLGLSGGKDSTIVAKLCVEAIGKDRVIGVAMPEDGQGLNEADEIAKHLGIKFMVAPIGDMVKTFASYATTNQSQQNVPPRVRMVTLYAISQSNNGRVMNTCNLSENYLGYETIFGDSAGDVSPLANLTVTEIKALGHELGIPSKWVEKIPDDGLPHSTSDEEKFGFTYAELDKYLRHEEMPSKEVLDKIKKRHKANLFKQLPMASFPVLGNPAFSVE